jgi:hypothetical protein
MTGCDRASNPKPFYCPDFLSDVNRFRNGGLLKSSNARSISSGVLIANGPHY